MRILTLLLVVALLSGCAEPKVAPDPVAFDFQGMRIGDAIPQDVAAKHSSSGEVVHDIVPVDESRVRAHLSYLHGKLAAVSLSFDDLEYYSLLDVYTGKLGEPHDVDEYGATWQTTDGEFELRKAGGGKIWGPAYREYLRQGHADDLEQLGKSL